MSENERPPRSENKLEHVRKDVERRINVAGAIDKIPRGLTAG